MAREHANKLEVLYLMSVEGWGLGLHQEGLSSFAWLQKGSLGSGNSFKYVWANTFRALLGDGLIERIREDGLTVYYRLTPCREGL